MSLLSPGVDEDMLNGSTHGGTVRKKKKSTKGWDGEAVGATAGTPVRADEHDGEL